MTLTSLGAFSSASFTKTGVVSNTGGEVTLTNSTSQNGECIYASTLTLAAGLIGEFTISGYVGSGADTFQIGIISGAKADTLNPFKTDPTFYGFLLNVYTGQAAWGYMAGAQVNSTSLSTSTNAYNAYTVRYGVSGTTLTMTLLRDGVVIATATGTAPTSFTTIRPVVAGNTGGIAALFKVNGTPTWNDLDLSSTGVTGLSAMPYSGGANVSWTATPGATSYDYRVNGGTPVTGLSSPVAQVTGLTNGTAYTVDVRPVNVLGAGTWTSLSVTPAAVYLFDSFNRADVTPSTTALGTSDDGHAWSQSLNIGITSGQAYPTSAAENLAYITGAGFDQDITAQFSASQAVSGQDMGIIFRMKDTSNYWLAQVQNNNIQFVRKNAGSFMTYFNISTVGFVSLVSPLVRILAQGSMIELFVNGVCKFGVDDTYSNSATDTGLGLRLGGTPARVDWLYAKAAVAVNASGFIYKGRDTKVLDTAGAA